MDHIPLPQGADPLFVPYVASNWDEGSFSMYPDRCGMRVDIVNSTFTSKPTEEYQSFFQTWLYFGLLNETFRSVGMFVDFEPFLTDTDSGQYIDSSRLNVYFDEWRHLAKSYRDEESKAKIWEPIQQNLDIVNNHVNGTLVHFGKYIVDKYDDDLPQWPAISLSIAMLGYTLQEIGNQLYLTVNKWVKHRWGDYRLLYDRFERSQWCKADVKRFMGEEPPDFLLFVSSIRSPRRHENHEECTQNRCRGRMADVDAMKQKHVRDDCRCQFVSMPEEFANAVDRGDIPLAHWDGANLRLLNFDNYVDTPYVAISHVWSDGKGNEEANALYKCQLDLIQENINKLYAYPRESPSPGNPLFGPLERRGFQDPWRQPVGFWMDTLCIPVRDDQKALRKKAIAQMREIYESADRVLVFDSIMDSIETSSSIYDRSVSVIISNWQHRLWTLQEGVLGRQACFVLKDGVVTLDELKKDSLNNRSEKSPGFFSSVCNGLAIVPVFNLTLFLDALIDKADDKIADNFQVLTPTIMNRVTTKQEDETICMATVLRMDVEPLLEISSRVSLKKLEAHPRYRLLAEHEEARVCNERMQLFLLTVKYFEENIIFNQLPRLSTDGFRWAPRSFLGQSGSFIIGLPGRDSSQNKKVRILESHAGVDGFGVKFPGIILDRPKMPDGPKNLYFFYENQLYRSLLKLEFSSSSLDDGEFAIIMGWNPRAGFATLIPSIFGKLRGRTVCGFEMVEHICLATTEALDEDGVGDFSEETVVGMRKKWCVM